MVSLRFKPLKDGQFSAYLDMYHKDSTGKKNRKYEFLQIKVSKDYSHKGTRVKEIDRDNLELAEGIRAKRELELINGIYGIKQLSTDSQTDFLAFLEQEIKRKRTNVEYNSALRVKLNEFLGVERPLFSSIDQDALNIFCFLKSASILLVATYKPSNYFSI